MMLLFKPMPVFTTLAQISSDFWHWILPFIFGDLQDLVKPQIFWLPYQSIVKRANQCRTHHRYQNGFHALTLGQLGIRTRGCSCFYNEAELGQHIDMLGKLLGVLNIPALQKKKLWQIVPVTFHKASSALWRGRIFFWLSNPLCAHGNKFRLAPIFSTVWNVRGGSERVPEDTEPPRWGPGKRMLCIHWGPERWPAIVWDCHSMGRFYGPVFIPILFFRLVWSPFLLGDFHHHHLIQS